MLCNPRSKLLACGLQCLRICAPAQPAQRSAQTPLLQMRHPYALVNSLACLTHAEALRHLASAGLFNPIDDPVVHAVGGKHVCIGAWYPQVNSQKVACMTSSWLAWRAFMAILSELVASGRSSRSLARAHSPCTGHQAKYSAARGHVCCEAASASAYSRV